MKEEFIEAYNRLKEDPQPINLTLPKLEAWLLLTPIQLASKHPDAKKSYIIREAVKTAKVIQTLIVGNSKILTEVGLAGWQGREPKVSVEKFQTEMEKLSLGQINVQLSKEQAWCIVAASQLGHRHSIYKGTKSARINKQMLDQIATGIPENILSILLNAGWDTRFDQISNKKGFGKA